jgi:VIT1/CCC1 family predicted Fe2+/Mn2+ transporter
LQAQLEEERRIREEMQVTMQANQQRMDAMVVEREAEQRKMAEILQFIQSLGAAIGVAPPPTLFAPPMPPHATTPVSINVLVCMFMFRVKPQH